MIRIIFLFFFVVVIFPLHSVCQKNVFGLSDTTTLLKQTKSSNDSLKWDAYVQLAKYFLKKNQSVRAEQYNRLQVALAEKTKNSLIINRSKIYSIDLFSLPNKSDTPKEILPLLAEAKKLKDDLGIYQANACLGRYYTQENKSDQAFIYWGEALKTAQKANLLPEQSNALQSLTRLCYMNTMLDKALEYSLMALPVREKIGNPDQIIITYTSLGAIYEQMKKFEKSYEYQKKAMDLTLKSGNTEMRAIVYLNLAVSEGNLKRYEDALKHLTQSYHFAEANKDSAGMSNALLNIASNYNLQKKYHLSIETGLKALAIAKAMKNGLEFHRNSAYTLYESYEKIGDYKNAFFHYKTCKDLHDTLYNIQNKQKLIEAQTKFETEMVSTRNKLLAEQVEKDRYSRYLLIAALSSLGLLAGFIFYRYQNKIKSSKILQRHNDEMEAKNKLLSSAYNEINEKKVELENAYEELSTTLEQVQEQKQDILLKNLKIEDSIHYAYQIQTAILPDKELLNSFLPQHFIFYQPKDIVSGDFYWATVKDRLVFLCVADCTGHGVPGAFMSVVGSNALHKAVEEAGMTRPDEILHEADHILRRTLRQDNRSESKDGMDAAFCIFDLERKKLLYAGAGRPFYLFRGGELKEIKGDKFPIGGGQHDNKTFYAHTIDLYHGDRIYLFTDGITDQFGGREKRKFTPKRLQEFILQHQNESMTAQGILFHQTMIDWMMGHKQLDDLTLIALEV